MKTIGRKKSGGAGVPRFFTGSFGVGVLATILLIVGVPWWIVVPLAVVAFAGGILLLVPRKKTLNIAVEGMTQDMVEKTLQDGRKRTGEIGEAGRGILDRGVRKHIEEIRKQADLVLDEIEKDPRDIKAARQFLTYYLDATLKIIKQYGELSGRNRSSEPEIQALLRKAEGMLETIGKAFEKQRALLLENDALRLETELTVLDKTLKMQGLGGDAPKGGL